MTSPKDKEQEPKIPYESPRLFDLGGGVAYAQTPCAPGGSPAGATCSDGGAAAGGRCKQGNTAGSWCLPGGAAGSTCKVGNVPV